jgi:hypothetical protein
MAAAASTHLGDLERSFLGGRGRNDPLDLLALALGAGLHTTVRVQAGE